MTKTNLFLGAVVALLGVIAVLMLVYPQIIQDSVDKVMTLAQSQKREADSTDSYDNHNKLQVQEDEAGLLQKEVKEQVKKQAELGGIPFVKEKEVSHDSDLRQSSIQNNMQNNTRNNKSESMRRDADISAINGKEPARIDKNFRLKNADIDIKSEDYGDWRVECVKRKSMPEKEVCSMFQRLISKKQKQVIIMVKIVLVKVEGGDKGQDKVFPQMRIVVPLNTFLMTGITMQIENEKQVQMPFQLCTVGGCFVNITLGKEVIKKLKEKNFIDVSYVRDDRKIVNAKLSLEGFADALARLGKGGVSAEYINSRTSNISNKNVSDKTANKSADVKDKIK